MKSIKNRKKQVLLAFLVISILWTSLIVKAQDIMAQVLISDGNVKIN